MFMIQATEVRKNWSAVCDNVIHEKPQFVKRTRDEMCFSSFETMLDILSVYEFSVERFVEADGSITLALNEMDLAENAKTEEEAFDIMANSIKEYAIEYYENYKMYSNAPNRKHHIPYILKALLIQDTQKIRDSIKCQIGKN